ncbi:MAG TPA: hypothetical protein VK939_05550 [Longimicrobiales bacterium]|nr:hypothetical protein [Longimicrobiales bacterium]
MKRVLLALLLVLAVGAVAGTWALRPPGRVLRVCADPNNLPFSNERGEGFENRLAELLAGRARRVHVVGSAPRLLPQHAAGRGLRRGDGSARLVRAGAADPPLLTVHLLFVYRADAGFEIDSFDDPDLRRVRIGVPVVGDDGANPPPAHALAARGTVRNVSGYTVYRDYREPNPPARILDALVAGDIDVAIVWCPLAGWYARNAAVLLRLVAVRPHIEPPFLPFVFDIALGVRREDVALHQELEEALQRRAADVERLLDEYGVPRVLPGEP